LSSRFARDASPHVRRRASAGAVKRRACHVLCLKRFLHPER
jgi:hypothetical protein